MPAYRCRQPAAAAKVIFGRAELGPLEGLKQAAID